LHGGVTRAKGNSMENRLPPTLDFLHDDELLDGKDKKKIFLDFCFGEKDV